MYLSNPINREVGKNNKTTIAKNITLFLSIHKYDPSGRKMYCAPISGGCER
jgi:hypothetical protein